MMLEKNNAQKIITVTVDKSHLLTIGEKLYAEKLSFLRELVNNAYDADASEVYVEIEPTTLIIRDNGSGMDENGLRQYFTIGSPHKKTNDTSPRFGRVRIGEFGIGKFAALAACRRFEVETQRGEFRASLIFDKEAWSRHEDWHLNIDILLPDAARGDGTTITMREITDNFSPGKMRRYLIERCPLSAPKFAVFVNGEPVTDEVASGRKLPVNLSTRFGPITGALVITPTERRAAQLGIAVAVKGVLVRYESFGLETSRKWGVTRLTGKINANWLAITSSRDDFLRDTEEYLVFYETVSREVKKALTLIRTEGDRRANLQASRVLKDALNKIGRAMKSHSELFTGAAVPLGAPADEQKSNETGYIITQAEFVDTGSQLDPNVLKQLGNQVKKLKRHGRPSASLGDKSVIRTLKIANMDIAVRLEHLGEDNESRLVGGVIYINIDHPLYRTYHNNDELLTLHLARVITKELALQTGESDPARAFAIQADLLASALQSKGKK
jgi:hypothetical protein